MHVSMQMLAFSSKHHCVQMQPHEAASVAVDSWTVFSRMRVAYVWSDVTATA